MQQQIKPTTKELVIGLSLLFLYFCLIALACIFESGVLGAIIVMISVFILPALTTRQPYGNSNNKTTR